MRPHRLFAILLPVGLWACGSTTTPFPNDCESFLDATSSQSVTVTVRNDGPDAIYLLGTGCSATVDLELLDDAGDPLPLVAGSCTFSCEDLQETSAICDAACAAPPAIMIAPGGSYALSWNGIYGEEAEMPDSCYADPQSAPDSCLQRIAAPAGNYGFSVTTATSITCADSTCTCTPDASGSCLIDFGFPDGETIPAGATFSYPDELEVTVVLGSGNGS
ncbi:MAG: hypothetical protein R3B72_27715 [Polyangiaceae bacterium]